MTKFKNNKNYKFWHSPIALIILFLIIVFFGYSVVDLMKKSKDTSERKEALEQEIASLEQRSISLNDQIAKIDTEEGKEEIIRNKGPFAKSGEKMVTIVEEEKKAEKKEEIQGSKSFWQWIGDLFKK
jgi:cell division protein FtsB